MRHKHTVMAGECVIFPMGGEAYSSTITSTLLFPMLSFSMRTVFSHLYTLSFCPLSILYVLPSHTQLSHEIRFEEQFDCFPTPKVCLTEVAVISCTRYSPVTVFIQVFRSDLTSSMFFFFCI